MLRFSDLKVTTGFEPTALYIPLTEIVMLGPTDLLGLKNGSLYYDYPLKGDRICLGYFIFSIPFSKYKSKKNLAVHMNIYMSCCTCS